ncbi:hypothetical protein [Paenibacillus sp. Mc5Re-14]|nr:hypothetical protein [Paenibacillus sp. Mc5Re-14]
MFYIMFWLVAVAFFILLIAGGAHKKVQDKTTKFIEKIFEDEKENV